ncbi:hypothetical protein X560_2446 [Listeria fleischmannii 1991]|uniref:Uncharacterized protein n=2 Tax=Listeria fleischmannii TaxID=1069827 RepID=A0A2X3GS82_9LIST|nr:hypothetical protein [Listeria fleischmannii]EMG28417.1 hypothetical protein LFLEISCH_05405 [Listeria fleischmannii subsp. fleischmannii LU2006-1]KMT58005.1 hypothetical protein X560_2446 [Listeria fleischmannii 1991]SQC62144.1 Uncharacterised protein [Listeria fleischmannii subsp. fleischmannii]
MIDFEELKKQYLILYYAVREYGDSTNSSQLKSLEQLLVELDKESPDIKRIKDLNLSLYPPHDGISEFFVWDDNFEKRLDLNEPIDNAKKITWEMLN